jgi:hypothetical protein
MNSKDTKSGSVKTETKNTQKFVKKVNTSSDKKVNTSSNKKVDPKVKENNNRVVINNNKTNKPNVKKVEIETRSSLQQKIKFLEEELEK